MAGDELRMPVDAVRHHAASVDAAADGMQTGRDAAHIQMGTEAYGQICSFLPGLINPLGDHVLTALTESTTALRETATGLRSAADRAQTTDTNSSARLTGAGRDLELPL